jgi:GTP diphosphokinase / guanosine-3',5'-bis(diphosphate) 3'-diphosphatase
MELKLKVENKIAELLKLCNESTIAIDTNKVSDACQTAIEILGTSTWESGEPIVLHSISVAKIVAKEMGLGTDSIITAVLHNVFESSNDKDILIDSIPRHTEKVCRECSKA